MESIHYVDLEKIVAESNKIYAHSKELDSKLVYETLLEHSETVLKNLKMLNQWFSSNQYQEMLWLKS